MTTPFITDHHHDFFKAACANVKTTKQAFELLHLRINQLITQKPLINNQELDPSILKEIQLLTRLAIPVYTAYTEAIFLKLIYTPNGFTKTEIDQILKVQKKQSIIEAWKIAIQTSAKKSIGKNSGFYPNSLKKINTLINQHLQEPSELRNKIAHGQWHTTFNKYNSSLTPDTSAKIRDIDIVKISKWVDIFNIMGELFFLSNQSPLKGYSEQYWNKITDIEELLNKRSNWSFEQKIKNMHKKKNYYKIYNSTVTNTSST